MEGNLRYSTILGNVPFLRYGLNIRLVEEADYEFIFLLRSDKHLGRHLSSINQNPENQKIWIRNYKNREMEGDEFYFMCLDPLNNERLGVFRLYNFTDTTFATGSWLFKPGLKLQPILGNIIGKEIGFNLLKYATCKFDVRKNNAAVLAYHRLFNPVKLEEDELNIYFELSNTSFETTKTKLLRLYGFKFPV